MYKEKLEIEFYSYSVGLMVQLALDRSSKVAKSERIVRPAHNSTDTTETHMRLGSGDPRLQKERKARLVKLPGGLHSDEDVLLLQFWLADARTLSG